MTEKRFEVYDDGFSKHIEDTYYTEDRHENNLYDIWDMCRKLNELYEENQKMKQKGLNVLEFYINKLKNTNNDIQSVRNEIWIIKQVLYEMGVLDE